MSWSDLRVPTVSLHRHKPRDPVVLPLALQMKMAASLGCFIIGPIAPLTWFVVGLGLDFADFFSASSFGAQ